MYRADFQYKHYKVMYEKHGKKIEATYIFLHKHMHVPLQIFVQVKNIQFVEERN